MYRLISFPIDKFGKILILPYFSELKYINISSITEIIEKISFPKSLEKFDISMKCKIQQDNILCLNLIELNARDNPNINDVSHMSNLQVLNVSGLRGIGQNGINGLKLIELYIDDNDKITDISHMTKLQILSARERNTKLKQYIINRLTNLIKLKLENNRYISDVSHLTNLQI